jgi:guanylate kinase
MNELPSPISDELQKFQNGWDYIEHSNRPIDPILFQEAGFDWYKKFHKTDIPYIWQHETFKFPELKDGKLGGYIAGPSNVGKDAIINTIIDLCPGLICPVVTATDRPKRVNERDGIDQIFLTPEQFKSLADAGKFIEKSPTRPPYWFGVPKTSIIAATECAQIAIFRITLDGIITLKPLIEKSYFPTIRIAVIPNVTLNNYKENLLLSHKENPFIRYQTGLKEMWRIGQPKDLIDFVVVNPWDPSGKPIVAANSLHELFHRVLGTTHKN